MTSVWLWLFVNVNSSSKLLLKAGYELIMTKEIIL